MITSDLSLLTLYFSSAGLTRWKVLHFRHESAHQVLRDIFSSAYKEDASHE